jgi:hypothetical protein
MSEQTKKWLKTASTIAGGALLLLVFAHYLEFGKGRKAGGAEPPSSDEPTEEGGNRPSWMGFRGGVPKGMAPPLPEVRAFRDELTGAQALDSAEKMKNNLRTIKEGERALSYRAAVANRELGLERLFQEDPDLSRFYRDQWQEIRSPTNREVAALLTRYVEEVLAGDRKLSPQAAAKVITEVAKHAQDLKERLHDAEADLSIIIRLAEDARKRERAKPQRTNSAYRRAGPGQGSRTGARHHPHPLTLICPRGPRSTPAALKCLRKAPVKTPTPSSTRS